MFVYLGTSLDTGWRGSQLKFRVKYSLVHHWGLPTALVIVALSGLTALHQPAFGDAQAYMISNGEQIAATSFYPFIENEVHPPFYFLLEAVAFKTMGAKIEVAHGLIIICALVAVGAVYAAGLSLGGPAVASCAVVLLATWPPFLIQTRLIRLSVPLTAFSCLTILSALRGWRWAYVVFGAAAALTKAPGVLVSGALASLGLLGLYKPRLPRWLLWVPVGCYASWLVTCKMHYGWFLFPENVGDFRFSLEPLIRGWSYWARRLVFDQYAWLPMTAAVLLPSRRPWLMPIPVIIGGLLGQWQGFTWIHGSAMGLFAAIIVCLWIYSGHWRPLALFAIAMTLLFTPYTYRFPRYLLPIWPGLALFMGARLSRIRMGLPIVLLSMALFGSAALDRHRSHGPFHESTLAYIEDLSCRKAAASYLEAKGADITIMARKPAEDLLNPSHGYVTRKLIALRLGDAMRRGCSGLGSVDYYYELPTATGKSEKRTRRILKQCGFELVPEWSSPCGGQSARIFRIVGTHTVEQNP